jgi:hypothetical protein
VQDSLTCRSREEYRSQGVAVIAQEPLHHDASSGLPCHGAPQIAGGDRAFLFKEYWGVVEPPVVVGGHWDVLPADSLQANLRSPWRRWTSP